MAAGHASEDAELVLDQNDIAPESVHPLGRPNIRRLIVAPENARRVDVAGLVPAVRYRNDCYVNTVREQSVLDIRGEGSDAASCRWVSSNNGNVHRPWYPRGVVIKQPSHV
jgi:hypothetical protein